MKRLNTVARLTFWLATIFATVFLLQAESRDKHPSTTQPKKLTAPGIRIVDQNGQPAVSGVPSGGGQIFDVAVGQGGDVFVPDKINISAGDTVRWTWAEGGHSVTSGDPCIVDGQYCSPDDLNCDQGILSDQGTVYEHTFTEPGVYSYFCHAHCGIGMTGVVNVSAGACSWSAGADLPVAGIRFSGVFFPANGKFYAMGGRDLQTGGIEFTNPFEYDPVTNSWTTKAATYPDPFVGNTECAVANDSGTDYIYCVGGSQSSTATETGRVFRYDPVADVITTVATNWPPGDASTLPGGITVFNNTIYILGGYDVLNVVSTDQIWAFTPNPAGWELKGATLPVPLGYIPTATIGSLIYTAGGFDAASGTDQTNSFVYDPVADSITTIASIPRPSSNTRGLNFCNQFYVMGGGGFPTYFNEVDIYDPVSDTWSLGTPFVTARRNSANDTDGSNNIWLAGGLDENLGSLASTEIFNCPVSPCGVPSPTPTPTPSVPPVTPTPTPSVPPVTPTPTPSGTPPPTATPRVTPRPRPTPHPRPTP
jgi:plastocyanin/N-acetylneuraminic acid mutarotase